MANKVNIMVLSGEIICQIIAAIIKYLRPAAFCSFFTVSVRIVRVVRKIQLKQANNPPLTIKVRGKTVALSKLYCQTFEVLSQAGLSRLKA